MNNDDVLVLISGILEKVEMDEDYKKYYEKVHVTLQMINALRTILGEERLSQFIAESDLLALAVEN